MIGRVTRDGIFRMWMFWNVVFVAAFILTACQQPPAGGDVPRSTLVAEDDNYDVERWEDPKNGNVCYIVDQGTGNAISCVHP